MTVLHLISSGGLYGAEAVILNLSRVLREGGEHRSVLGVFDHGPQAPRQLQQAARVEGLEIHEIVSRGQLDRHVPTKIRALAENTGADVVHAHGYKADVYTALAFRGAARRPLVSTCHTWYDNDFALRLYGALDRRALRGFDGVVAVSADVQSRLIRAGVKSDRIRFIRNGVDLRPFAGAMGERAGRHLPGTPGVLRVGLAGRLSTEKGIDIFLRAIAHWLGARADATIAVEFVVVGEGPDRSKLEALRAELGLAQQVRFEGHRSDMAAFYASLDILVSASRQEGLPMALLEGMASGLPLLATAVGEVPQLAGDGQTALIVAPNDPSALASGLDRLVVDARLRNSLGQAGQQLISGAFSAEAMTDEYLKLYRSVEGTPQKAYVGSGHAAQVR